LGLFGLSSLTILQRTKEIGVRKVLEASVTSILSLVSKDYLILISVSVILSVPLTWWIMNIWLQGFASRIPLTLDNLCNTKLCSYGHCIADGERPYTQGRLIQIHRDRFDTNRDHLVIH